MFAHDKKILSSKLEILNKIYASTACVGGAGAFEFGIYRTSHPPTGDRPNWTERGEVTCGQVTLRKGDRVRRPTLNNGLLDQGFIGLPHLSLPIRISFIGDTRI